MRRAIWWTRRCRCRAPTPGSRASTSRHRAAARGAPALGLAPGDRSRGCAVRRSGWHADYNCRTCTATTRRDIRLHALSAAGLLSGDRNPVGRAAACDQGAIRRSPARAIAGGHASIRRTTRRPCSRRMRRARGADPAVWRFVTGDVRAIDAFGRQFGLAVTRRDARRRTSSTTCAPWSCDARLASSRS